MFCVRLLSFGFIALLTNFGSFLHPARAIILLNSRLAPARPPERNKFMEQEKSKVNEYHADYRGAGKTVVKAATITSSTPARSGLMRRHAEKVQENSAQTRVRSPKPRQNAHAKPSDRGTIKISQKTRHQISIYRFLFAGATMILAIVGVIILLSAVNRTSSVISDSSTYAKYNNYIAPVVMHDPTPFASPQEADSDMVVSSCIWRNLLQNGAEGYKEFDEQGLTLMPVGDVQRAAADLFGSADVINCSGDIFGAFYSHTAGDDNFHISSISNAGTFLPHIEEILEKKDELILTVSYLSREDKFLSSGEEKTPEPTPVKQMVYKLKLGADTDKYYISSIEPVKPQS